MSPSTRRCIGPEALAAVFVLITAVAVLAGDANNHARRTPAAALSGLDVADGLEATLFAAEPTLLSPTNVDVDHCGRVWVCEVVNYRHRAGSRPEGDRILILQDADGDGKADNSTVFYQGNDIDTAMGICVLGNRVIVSASPNILVLTDTDADDKADRKELLFTRTGQEQHDHSAHAFVFGPDGRLYWNFGNTGRAVHDKDGKVVVDLAGNQVVDDGNPYRGGMVFRCNPDGSNFEVLAHNFRNNYEVAVDSFGTLWQSDNDDDGNRGVRINYVMEFGNYGYRDEMTGAGWRAPRTGMHEQIPKRHWHLSDPGVVPNLLQTGAGSPTGIAFYEGELLPAVFRAGIIHCDAGPNVVRAYPVENNGAGYKADLVNIVHGARDQWFRPSDVCVAPDGSLIVADWYDPGVGGHRMGDIEKGRIYRIAPPKQPYRMPDFDFSTPEGALEALKNPNLATRYLAWTALHEMQARAEPALLQTFGESDRPRYRARALWLLGRIEGRGRQYVARAVDDADPNIRITGVRLARALEIDMIPVVAKLVHDPSPQVRRECAIALRHNEAPKAVELWAELAQQHDGRDRWYLEALGIAADGHWDGRLSAWLATVDDAWNTPAGRDIIWRSRAAQTPRFLAKIISDPAVPKAELPRYLRAFDFLPDEPKQPVLQQLAFDAPDAGDPRWQFVAAEAVSRLNGFDLDANPAHKETLDALVGTHRFVRLVDKFSLRRRYPQLLDLAGQHPAEQIGVDAVRLLLAKKQHALFRKALGNDDVQIALDTTVALGTAADNRAVPLLWPLVAGDGHQISLRRQAVQSLARSQRGALRLIRAAREGRLDDRLKDAAAVILHSVAWNDIRQQAAELFPLPPAKNDQPLPPVGELLQRKGSVERGRVVFNTTGTCAKCHIVGGMGKDIGPNLSEIGNKLSREALFHSILFPNAGISHNYETYVALLESGNVVTGILTDETADSISLKDADAIVRTVDRSQIELLKRQDISLMPADLQKTMTADELVDVVEYLTTLRRAASE